MTSRTQNTNVPKKYGRTLLFKPTNGTEMKENYLSHFTGVVAHTRTKTTGSYFVTFDTAENATSAYNFSKENFTDTVVKWSYYRVFFTMNGLVDEDVSADTTANTTAENTTANTTAENTANTTANTIANKSQYNSVKESFVKFLEDTTKSSVLYFKLYRKNGRFIGCGDFTLDTLDGMNVLLDKTSGLKEYSLNGLTGRFFRYNSTKSKTLDATN
jgi:hypothetical protein